MSNRNEKSKYTLEILLRADLLYHLFLAEHGRIIRLNWINSFCLDRNFTIAVHFLFQCETLKSILREFLRFF